MIHSLFLASGLPDEAHKKAHHRKSYGGRSREDRIRTCDPLVPNQVRYRPALLPAFAKSSAGNNRKSFSEDILYNRSILSGHRPPKLQRRR